MTSVHNATLAARAGTSGAFCMSPTRVPPAPARPPGAGACRRPPRAAGAAPGAAAPGAGRAGLPLAGEHAVALEVAEGSVVGHDLEAVAQRLQAPARPVAPVAPVADQVLPQLL